MSKPQAGGQTPHQLFHECLFNIFTANLFTLLGKKMQHFQGLCSLPPEYNMCKLRGCSVSDSFVAVIGAQMAFRSPVCAPYFDYGGSNCASFRGEQKFARFTIEYNNALLMSMYSWWTTSAIWMGSHCRPARSWMDILTGCCTCWAQCIGSALLLSAIACRIFLHP